MGAEAESKARTNRANQTQVQEQILPTQTLNMTNNSLENRPFVNIPIRMNGKLIPTKWLLDTGSQISIINTLNNQNESKKWIGIAGENATQKVPVTEIELQLCDKTYKIQAASFAAPCSVLGIGQIKEIFPEFLQYKKIKKVYTNLAEVKLEPVMLFKIKPSFTPQYPIKGGIEEITKTVQELLRKGIIAPTQSSNYNSPVWPVLKSNGKYRFTVDYRKINEKSPKMPGSLPDIEDIFLRIRQKAPKWLATIDLSDMFFGIPLDPISQEVTTFTWQNKQHKFLRLPQGYLNSPIIVHTTLTRTLEDFDCQGMELLSYVDDIIVFGQEKSKVGHTVK